MEFRANSDPVIWVQQFRQVLGASRSGLVAEIAYYALRPRTFVIYGGFMVVASGLRAYRWTQNLGDVVLVIAAAVVTLVIGASIAWLIRTKVAGQALWKWALVLWMSTAVIRHLAEVEASHVQAISSSQVTVTSLVLSIGSTSIWVVLIAGFQAVNSFQQSTTESLRLGIERLRTETKRRWAELDEERSRLAASVQQAITPVLQDLMALLSARDSIAGVSGFAAIASSVAEDSRALVRQASHEMSQLAQRSSTLAKTPATEGDPIASRRGRRPVLAAANARVEPISVLVALPALGFAAPAPVPGTVLRLLLAALLAYVFLSAIAWAVPRMSILANRPSLLVVLGGNALGVLGGIVVSGWMIGSLVDSSPQTIWLVPGSTPWFEILVWLIGTIVAMVVSLIVADRRMWMDAARQLAQTQQALDLLDIDMRRQYERMTAQTASMLHGPIQGRLATVGMTLRFAGDQVSAEQLVSLEALLRECEVDLMRASIDPRHEHASAWDVLIALRSQWAGLLDITWTLSVQATKEIDSDSVLVRNLETLVADLASNASRHGSAREVHLEISLTDSHLRVQSRDDGTGPLDPVSPGIGLGSLSAGRLSIAIDPDGRCCVTALIPRPQIPAVTFADR